jgi:soluble lytic murein transglycosylase
VEALWDLASYGFQTNHCDKALPLFERYAATSDGVAVKARGLYWAARCAARLGKRSDALARYRAVLAIEPLHWYALLARAQLQAAGADPGPPFGSAVVAAPVGPNDPRRIRLPEAAEFYVSIGLVKDAINALRQQESSLRESGDDDRLTVLISAYHALGEYNRPFHLAERQRGDLLMHPPRPEVRAIWDALFPRPYIREVGVATETSPIASELVYAVMRKESAFNASIVSYADAIGLMQLIERTAKVNAQELGIAHFERAMLYDPATNVLLGAHYLSKLVTRYRGHAVPAIAAYNAGEHAVDRWLKRGAGKSKTVEIDWFVEDIPIDQTRNYVKGVVTSWARYSYLEQQNGWPIELALTLKL